MKIHGELWRRAKDGDDLINYHRRRRFVQSSSSGEADRLAAPNTIIKISVMSTLNRTKIIDSAVSLRYMSHALKVKIAVMSLLTAATWLWPYSSIKASHCIGGCGPH